MDLPALSKIGRLRSAVARLGDPWSWVTVTAAGSAAGFFAWSLSVPQEDFHSFYFYNNLSVDERLGLLIFLVVGVVVFLLGWTLAPLVFRNSTRREIAHVFSLGIVTGFWPLLNIQALEVFYPFQAFFLMIGMLAILFLVSRRIFRPTRLIERTASVDNRWAFGAVLILACGYAAFFGVYTVGKHLTFHSYAFDLGWQNQVFYTLLHTGNPRVTAFITVNHLSDHFQPLYYLLAPLYALYQDPILLLLLQAVMLPAGAIPLFLIARRKLGSSWIALIVALVFLLYPAMHGANTYDFHGVVLLIPIVCFLFYFLETGRMKLYWLFFALALIVREDAPISLLGVGLYAWLALKKPALGLASLAICLGYFLLIGAIMTAMGGSPNLQNYWALTLPEHQDFLGVALTLFTNPAFVLRHAFFNTDKLLYLLQLFVPVLFLPFFSGRKLILVIPGLAIILLSGTDTQYSIGFHYSSHIIASVFYLSICGIDEIRTRWPKVTPAMIALPLLIAGISMNYEYGLVLSKRFAGFFRPDGREQTASTFFRMIPSEASVAATARLYPHLSSRTEIYLLDRMRDGTDFVLADLNSPEPARDPYEVMYSGHAIQPQEVRRIILDLLDTADYGAMRYERGFILLQRGYATTRNDAVRKEILATVPEVRPEIIPYYTDPARRISEMRYSESDRFTEFLRSHGTETMLIVGNGDIASKLSYMSKLHLIYRGSNIHTLRAHGSYVAIMRENRIVLEMIDNRSPIALSTADSERLRKVLPGVDVSLLSSGEKAGRSLIEINGAAFPFTRRGFNLLVLDNSFHVGTQVTFDTGR